MRFDWKSKIFIGLLVILNLAKALPLQAAGSDESKTDQTDRLHVVIEIDEIQLASFQQLANSAQRPEEGPQSPASADLEAGLQDAGTHPREVEEIAAAPNMDVVEPPADAARARWNVTHSAVNIMSDLASFAGSSIFLSTRFSTDSILFPLSAGIAAGSSVIELFRGFNVKLTKMRANPKSVSSVCTSMATAGQIISIAGLSMLAGGAPVDASVWILVGGSLVKFGTFATQLSLQGINQTFGNNHTVTNSIFRIGLLGVGTTSASLVLASGVSTASEATITGSIYALSLCSLLGNTEIFARDIQDLQATIASLNRIDNP